MVAGCSFNEYAASRSVSRLFHLGLPRRPGPSAVSNGFIFYARSIGSRLFIRGIGRSTTPTLACGTIIGFGCEALSDGVGLTRSR